MQTGTASIRFERPPRILQAASVVGPKEAEGPFGALFDEIDSDGKCGQDNWEQAESELQKRAVKKVIEKAHLLPKQIRYVFAGDLLGQCIASSFGISELNCPTIGMYGACSTMAYTFNGCYVCECRICRSCTLCDKQPLCLCREAVSLPI